MALSDDVPVGSIISWSSAAGNEPVQADTSASKPSDLGIFVIAQAWKLIISTFRSTICHFTARIINANPKNHENHFPVATHCPYLDAQAPTAPQLKVPWGREVGTEGQVRRTF